MDQVLLVHNRYGTLYHVTRSHYDALKEAHGLVIVDERRDLIQCHPTPTGPTIRAIDIEQKRAESNDSGVGSSPPSPAPVALLKEKHVGKPTTEKRVGIPAPADGTVTELPAKTKTKRATGGRPRRAR